MKIMWSASAAERAVVAGLSLPRQCQWYAHNRDFTVYCTELQLQDAVASAHKIGQVAGGGEFLKLLRNTVQLLTVRHAAQKILTLQYVICRIQMSPTYHLGLDKIPNFPQFGFVVNCEVQPGLTGNCKKYVLLLLLTAFHFHDWASKKQWRLFFYIPLFQLQMQLTYKLVLSFNCASLTVYRYLERFV